MNYRLQLVVGDGAPFFLEEWAKGGVEITERVVGLFISGKDERGSPLDEALAEYGLRRVSFGLKQLLKIGFSREWTWTGIRWLEPDPSLETGILSRIQRSLGPGLMDDRERQVLLLKQVQAAARRLGDPAFIEGVVARPAGRAERILVYAGGIVAYDRTPHPLAFLRAVAAAAEWAPAGAQG